MREWGLPEPGWDRIAGFGAGDDVLRERRREDALALGELGASPRWLDFVEHQYLDRSDWVGASDTWHRLETELRALDPTAIFVPFGIANPDHAATHESALLVRDRYPEPCWFAYGDFGYNTSPACSPGVSVPCFGVASGPLRWPWLSIRPTNASAGRSITTCPSVGRSMRNGRWNRSWRRPSRCGGWPRRRPVGKDSSIRRDNGAARA